MLARGVSRENPPTLGGLGLPIRDVRLRFGKLFGDPPGVRAVATEGREGRAAPGQRALKVIRPRMLITPRGNPFASEHLVRRRQVRGGGLAVGCAKMNRDTKPQSQSPNPEKQPHSPGRLSD